MPPPAGETPTRKHGFSRKGRQGRKGFALSGEVSLHMEGVSADGIFAVAAPQTLPPAK